MATVTVTLDNGSMELMQAQYDLQQAQLEDPTLTVESYISNLVSGYFKHRAHQIYDAHVKTLTIEELVELFGTVNDIRS